MKKKLISLLLVSAMAAATAGCGSSVPANSVNSRDDLPGKKIGVQLGTTGDSDATEYEKNDGSTVERYNKGAAAIQALKTGKIDCVIMLKKMMIKRIYPIRLIRKSMPSVLPKAIRI